MIIAMERFGQQAADGPPAQSIGRHIENLMNTETLAVIQTVALEAIKILGPASIAAFAAYKAASVQIEIKLKELDRGHQFQARSAIFENLNDRLAHIEQQTEKLNADLAHMLGFAGGFRLGEQNSEASSEVIDIMTRTAESAAKSLPLEISVLLGDMQAAGLGSSDEFASLARRRELVLPLSGGATYARLKTLVVESLETSNLLGICTRLLLRKEMERVYAPYLKSADQ